jgi:hypothetical protein
MLPAIAEITGVCQQTKLLVEKGSYCDFLPMLIFNYDSQDLHLLNSYQYIQLPLAFSNRRIEVLFREFLSTSS